MLTLLRLATVLLVAAVAGLALAHVLEARAKLHYDAVLYITLQKSLYVQWGPPRVGGFLEPATIVATGLLAVLDRNGRRASRVAVAPLLLLLLAFPAVFFWMVAPTNAAFAAATLPEMPPDWIALRSSWETGHAIRCGLQFAALATLVWPLASAAALRGRAAS